MRYLPLSFEELKGKWIAIRDADTLFVYEMYNIAWMMERFAGYKNAVKEYNAASEEKQSELQLKINDDGYYFYKGSESGLPDNTDKFEIGMILCHLITMWEMEFINIYKTRAPIVFGIGDRYQPSWRLNYDPNGTTHFYADFCLYARFVTFFESRPNDIWDVIYKFITMRFKKSTLTNKMTNKDTDHYIGKDERVLLFALLPKYSRESTLFLVKYISDVQFDYSITCMHNGNEYAEENGIQISPRIIKYILQACGKAVNNSIDTLNPANAMAWIFDMLTPPLQSALIPILTNGHIYNASQDRNNCRTRPLATIMLQPDYVKAMSNLKGFWILAYRGINPISIIINTHVSKYKSWCKEHYPEWGAIVFPERVVNGARRTYRKKKIIRKSRRN